MSPDVARTLALVAMTAALAKGRSEEEAAEVLQALEYGLAAGRLRVKVEPDEDGVDVPFLAPTARG